MNQGLIDERMNPPHLRRLIPLSSVSTCERHPVGPRGADGVETGTSKPGQIRDIDRVGLIRQVLDSRRGC